MYRYLNMLKTEVREFVSTQRYQTLSQMMEAARARELELEKQSKTRKAEQGESEPKKAKFTRPKYDGSKPSGKKELPHCQQCGKNHSEVCLANESFCYKCGKRGHVSRDCTSTAKLCFQCYQPRHEKAECPQNLTRPVRAPAPATLRITNGTQGNRNDVPKGRGRVFQLTAEEARAEPDDVAGTLINRFVPIVILLNP